MPGVGLDAEYQMKNLCDGFCDFKLKIYSPLPIVV